MQQKNKQKCGFISIIGAPNAGKSTLINRLVGSKISIVSPKVQTTRQSLRGIVCHQQYQFIFVDTPGIFIPKNPLEKRVVKNAWSGFATCDYHLLIIDAITGIDEELKVVLEALQHKKPPITALINKVDTVSKSKAQELRNALTAYGLFEQIFEISALRGDNTEEVLDYLGSKMPESPWLYEEDDITDLPSKVIASEITREKIFCRLGQELPYSIKVETDSFTENEQGDLVIKQTIFVLRESQKKIALGSGGQMIKKIGELSRTELAEIFGKKVHLFLFVKVRGDWIEKSKEI